MVADALQLRFVEEDDAVARAREGFEDGADAEAIGPGQHAEVARAAPDGIAQARDVVGDGPPDQEAADPAMHPVKAAAHPAVEQRRADGDEASGPGIGILLEDLPDQDAAHAVADDVEGVALGLVEELLESAHVFVEALHHGPITKLAHAVAELTQPTPQQRHLPAPDDRAVDKYDGDAGGHRRAPRRIKPRFGHAIR